MTRWYAWTVALADYSMHLLWGGLAGAAAHGVLTTTSAAEDLFVFILSAVATVGVSLLRDHVDGILRDARASERRDAERRP